MSPQIVLFIVFLIVSLVVLGIGYLIKVRKQLSLIAGLDVSKVKDRDTLASAVGGGLLTVGIIDVLVSLLVFPLQTHIPFLIGLYCSVNILGFVLTALKGRNFFA